MSSKLIELEDGVLVEIDKPTGEVQEISGGGADHIKDATIERINPIILKAAKPIAEVYKELNRDMAAPVIDLLRRTEPGETFRLCMYGLSTSSPEYKELERAIGRGVKVRAVIYKAYNSSAIEALTRFKEEGFDVDLRIVKSRVMHEKFGVVGDDCFNGSANMSSSSITKHSEDRFLMRNQPEVADRYVEEFARLWDKGVESL